TGQNGTSAQSGGSFPLLVDALRLLPDVRPVCERHRLGEARHRALHAPDGTTFINGVSVTLQEIEELFLRIEWGSPRVSQQGAALLYDYSRAAYSKPARLDASRVGWNYWISILKGWLTSSTRGCG